MNKKSLDVKTAQKFIIESRNNGMTDQEIYNELSQQYFDKQSIAGLITATVTSESMSKYKVHRYILLGLIVLVTVFYLLSLIDFSNFTSEIGFILPITLLLSASIYMYVMLIKYMYAEVFKFCSIGAIWVAIRFLCDLRYDFVNHTYQLIGLIIIVLVVVLSYYISRKMFPNRRLKKLKRDSNGEYIFDERE